MSVPVRALVVDESASNAGLLFEELRRGGFEPVLRRVTSREDLEQALPRAAARARREERVPATKLRLDRHAVILS